MQGDGLLVLAEEGWQFGDVARYASEFVDLVSRKAKQLGVEVRGSVDWQLRYQSTLLGFLPRRLGLPSTA